MRSRLAVSLQRDFEDLYLSFGTWRMWRTLLATAFGALIVSIAINGIIIPQKFISGGITGLALLVFYVLKEHVPLSVIFWAVNIPILILGWRSMSLRYVFTSLAGVFMIAIGLQLTSGVRIPTSEPILAAILSGVLSGAGIGFYLRYGGSTGGMDIVATVIRKKFGIPMSTSFLMVNLLNVIAGGLLNNLDIALYTGISMYTYAFVLGRVQSGFSQRKSLFIVTSEPEAVAQEITKSVSRGVTFLHGEGAFTNKPQRVVYTVINMVELGRIKEILYRLDPNAFVAINDTAEVIGNRFISWEEQGFETKMKRAKRVRAS